MSSIDDLIREHCPNGVPHMELQALFTTRNGYTPAKSVAANWTDGTIPWFRMEDIRENGQVLGDSIQHIAESAVKGGKLFPANSIIVATSATIGEHALITVPHLSNQRFTSLSLRPEYADKFEIKFIYYYCFVLDEWCKNNTTVSSFASVDMAGFKKFKIPGPAARGSARDRESIGRVHRARSGARSGARSAATAVRPLPGHASDLPRSGGGYGGFRWVKLGSIFGGLTGKSKADFILTAVTTTSSPTSTCFGGNGIRG
jgi:type I restriction enzyme S subunit